MQLQHRLSGSAHAAAESRAEQRFTSASMACIIGSLELLVPSSAAGGEPPGGTTGHSISRRCSSSWCSRENPCEGSEPPMSIVERWLMPASFSVALPSPRRLPRHKRRMPAGEIPRFRSAGSTDVSQKASVVDDAATRTHSSSGEEAFEAGLGKRKKMLSISPSAEEEAFEDDELPKNGIAPDADASSENTGARGRDALARWQGKGSLVGPRRLRRLAAPLRLRRSTSFY